jgi:hypothetical protein
MPANLSRAASIISALPRARAMLSSSRVSYRKRWRNSLVSFGSPRTELLALRGAGGQPSKVGGELAAYLAIHPNHHDSFNVDELITIGRAS